MDIKTKLHNTKQTFDNDLVATYIIKTILMFNKSAFYRTCLLELSKVSMYEFHYYSIISYIKNTW